MKRPPRRVSKSFVALKLELYYTTWAVREASKATQNGRLVGKIKK